jgi:hypothetical protein
MANEVNMATEPKTVIHGALEENGDTWFVMTVSRMVLVDAPFLVDTSLKHQTVSIIGRMGIPESAPGITKLIAERIISHATIANAARARIQRNHIGCALLVWVRFKELAAQTGRTMYQLKHGLLDDYLIQQLRNPSLRMALA